MYSMSADTGHTCGCIGFAFSNLAGRVHDPALPLAYAFHLRPVVAADVANHTRPYEMDTVRPSNSVYWDNPVSCFETLAKRI